ncbi:unnamed protein product [Ectocarpus sp. 12 AP-2014]
MRATRIPITSASVQPSTLHVWATPRQNIPLFCRCATPFICRRATTRAGLEFHAKKQKFVASPLPRCSATTTSSAARLELDPCLSVGRKACCRASPTVAAGVGRAASSPAAWGWMVSRGADSSGPGGGSSTR